MSVAINEYNPGCSFQVCDVSYSRLCKAIESLPGGAFTRRPRFFWSSEDVGADFQFAGEEFEIFTDGWDGALWIVPKKHSRLPVEMEILLRHLEQHFGVVASCGGPAQINLR